MLRRPLSVIEFSPAEEEELVGRIKDLLPRKETPPSPTALDGGSSREGSSSSGAADNGGHQRRAPRPTDEIPMELE